MAQRPQIVLIVVIIVAVIGAILLLQGLGYLDIGPLNPQLDKPTDIEQDIWDLALSLVGYIMIGIGLVTLLVALLLYKGSNFARILSIIILILGVIVNALGLPGLVAIVELVLCVVLLYILFRPDVKQYFKS